MPCGAAVLCAEDLHAFCLEVSSGNHARTSQGQPELARAGRAAATTADAAAGSISQGEIGAEALGRRAHLGLAVRRLLVPLMAVPQPGAPSVATRLLASLRVRVLPACPRDRARSAAEHAALESACVLALLSWYRPAAPAETTRLAAFCAHAVPLMLHANDAPPPPQQQLSSPQSSPPPPEPCAPAALSEVGGATALPPIPTLTLTLTPAPTPTPSPSPALP